MQKSINWSDEEVKKEFGEFVLTKCNISITVSQLMDEFKESKKPKPLFTSDNGVEIFDRDEYFTVNKDFELTWAAAHENARNEYPLNTYVKRFSTKQAAQEYIDNNKPKYSIKDFRKIMDGETYETKHWCYISKEKLIEALKQLK